jgi:hypothetical protein
MNELEVIEITNPTSKDFSWRYNGELFTIKSTETRSFAKPVAFHLSKHLSTQMVVEDEMKNMTKADRLNPNASIHIKIAQLSTSDTHERRIALYKILGDENRVVELISKYPFKGFIGDMDTYKSFVEKSSKVVKDASKASAE